MSSPQNNIQVADHYRKDWNNHWYIRCPHCQAYRRIFYPTKEKTYTCLKCKNLFRENSHIFNQIQAIIQAKDHVPTPS